MEETLDCKIKNIRGVIGLDYIGFNAAVFIFIITAWRLIFTHFIGIRCGKYAASLQYGKLVKPQIISSIEKSKTSSKWKLRSLIHFYDNNLLHEIMTERENKEETIEKCEKIDFLKNSLNCSKSEIKQCFEYFNHCNKYHDCCCKFSEQLWKAITMFCLTIYGCFIIYNAEYFFDTKLLYTQWPQHHTIFMEFYYKLSLGYHGHRALFQGWLDTKRKDAVAMTIHHWVTVFLIVVSWYLGIMQFGCIVMFCHDNADFLLSLGKVCRYNEWKFLTNFLYAMFVASWIIFRIGLFSWKILYSVYTESVDVYDCHWFHPFLTSLICVLLVLHFYWLRMILNIAFKKCCHGKEITDTTSPTRNRKTKTRI